MGYPMPEEPAETIAVMAVYDEFYQALAEGRAHLIFPEPQYEWRFYAGERTIERWRKSLADLDYYWQQQQSYVSGQTHQAYEAGPELSRLPDAAVMALFQRLDAVLAGDRRDGSGVEGRAE